MAIGLSCLLLQVCKQKDAADSKKPQENSLFVEVPEDGKLIDARGDVRPTTATTNVAFIDLTEMTVNVTDNNITVTITVDNLPDQFTYNPAEPDHLEYSWKILFDTDNNSKTNAGDLALYLAHLRHAHTMGAEKAQGALLDFAKPAFHIVSKANRPGYSDTGFFDGNISTTVTENTITFSVEKSSHVMLNNITSSTKVRFEAHYLDGSNSYFSDYYPNGNK